jgi:pyruvate/2-oxoglutarate dehydrogenase complex dihydrolipoamide acyltransferase (E2) component
VANIPWWSEEESSTVPKQNQKPSPPRQEPGPGRSTAEQAFNDVRKEIAERNERAHQEARRLRAVREQERMQMRRDRDS